MGESLIASSLALATKVRQCNIASHSVIDKHIRVKNTRIIIIIQH